MAQFLATKLALLLGRLCIVILYSTQSARRYTLNNNYFYTIEMVQLFLIAGKLINVNATSET
jgi:hypothetical protein